MSNQDDTAATPTQRLFGYWLDATARLTSGVIRANRSLLGANPPAERPVRRPPERPGVAFTTDSWTVETEFARPAAVTVGDVVRFSKPLDEDDVAAFAVASGDTNRLHLDAEFADETRFGGPIVHGTLVSGLVSAALARLPGLVIYLSQETRFLGPVAPGQEAAAVCEVVEDLGGGKFRVETDVLADGETVVEGEAVVLIDDLPGDAD